MRPLCIALPAIPTCLPACPHPPFPSQPQRVARYGYGTAGSSSMLLTLNVPRQPQRVGCEVRVWEGRTLLGAYADEVPSSLSHAAKLSLSHSAKLSLTTQSASPVHYQTPSLSLPNTLYLSASPPPPSSE